MTAEPKVKNSTTVSSAITGPNVTKCTHNVDKSLPLNLFKSEVRSSKPFRNAGDINEDIYADVADLDSKLDAMATSLSDRKKTV